MDNVIEKSVAEVLKDNFMPYSAYTILNRALVRIDGFKPVQRRLLFMMKRAGTTYDKPYKKSASSVTNTMFLNPHGDTSIYESMVRMAKDNETLLVPMIDSKGNFGKIYSTTSEGAMRYTEARLTKVACDMMKGIEKGIVPMVDNYDSTIVEPLLIPTPFPNILCNDSAGIAVGVASKIPSFNLGEVIDYTIALLTKKEGWEDPSNFILAPDYPTGGTIVYDKVKMDNILKTGRGSFLIRPKYTITGNKVMFHNMPHGVKAETSIKKLIDLKNEKVLNEITEINDRYGLNTTGVEVVLKKNADAEKFVERVFAHKVMQTSISTNMTFITTDGRPKVMGVQGIIYDWLKFRAKVLNNELNYDKNKLESQISHLEALKIVLLDIEKAIDIIKSTKSYDEMIQSLMVGYEITEEQAKDVAEIKLKNFNAESFNKNIERMKGLKDQLAIVDKRLSSKVELAKYMVEQLKAIKEEYGEARKTDTIDVSEAGISDGAVMAEDYPVTVYITKNGFVKKIPTSSIRSNYTNKLQDGDSIIFEKELMNNSGEIIAIVKDGVAMKKNIDELEDVTMSSIGQFLPVELDCDARDVVYAYATESFDEKLVYGYDNGKVAVVETGKLKTKQRRKEVKNSYNTDAKLLYVSLIDDLDGKNLVAVSVDDKALYMDLSKINPKKSMSSAGNIYMKSDIKKYVVDEGFIYGKEYDRASAGTGLKGRNIAK